MIKRIQLPKLDGSRGAPMGRGNSDVSGKCRLQLVEMSDGAYDIGGAYWGIADPLYVCEDVDKNLFFVRAKSRVIAKEKILEFNPSVTFYR